MTEKTLPSPQPSQKVKPHYGILAAISGTHMLNDMMQSLIIAIYPILSHSFSLSYAQIGLITLTNQVTASFLQPFIGYYTDKCPKPYSLPLGMCSTFVGLILVATATHFYMIIIAAALVGVGSAFFHPESSRVARMASGGSFGMAQSFFQVGGNFGTSLGPFLAAIFITPYGKQNIGYFSLIALLAIVILLQVSKWYQYQYTEMKKQPPQPVAKTMIPRKIIIRTLVVLLILVFSKMFYLSSLTSYYIFYLESEFKLPYQTAQIFLFIFLLSVAAGTFLGGPIGDRIGRKYVIWFSILGAAPFTLLLPYASLYWTAILSVVVGLVLSSAFSAIVVYAQEIIPGKVGTIAGLFFGFSFGMGGLGAAILGKVADMTSIHFVYSLCSFLPLLGILTIFLPNITKKKKS